MKKLWLEMDVAGTLGDDAWIDMEQPKGFMEGGVLTDKKAPCDHPVEQPHSEGEWTNIILYLLKHFPCQIIPDHSFLDFNT